MSKDTKMSAGRPPLFDTPEALQEMVDSYFEMQKDDNAPPPTITGLSLFLGFESRQSFYDYEEKEEFTYTVKRARTMIECKYEQKLHTQACTGAIFALKNMGWKDKSEQEFSGSLGIKQVTGMEVK